MSYKVIKMQSFRKKQTWEESAKDACMWINANLSVRRIVGITSIHCSANNENLINIYYNDGMLEGTYNSDPKVICYQVVRTVKKGIYTWKKHHEERLMKEMNETCKKGDIVAVNSFQILLQPASNVTIIWYSRIK